MMDSCKKSIDELEEAIHLFLNPPSQEIQREAENYIQQWQCSIDSVMASFEIISKSTKTNTRFIAGSCIRHFLQTNFRDFTEENLNQIVSLLLHLITSDLSQINNSDFKLFLVIICDICLLNTKTIEQVLQVLPKEIIVLFFRILLEEAIESFIQKFDIDSNFKKLLMQLCPYMIKSLEEYPVTSDWIGLFSLVFKRFESSDMVIHLLPKIEEAINVNELAAGLFGIFNESFTFYTSYDDSIFSYLEAIIRMSLKFISIHSEYAIVLFSSFFSYDFSFFFDESKMLITSEVIEIFLTILENAVFDNLVIDCCEKFSKFLAHYPISDKLFHYIITYLTILINAVNNASNDDMLNIFNPLFYIILNDVNFNVMPQSQIINNFLLSQPYSNGFFVLVHNFSSISEEMSIHILNDLFKLQNPPKASFTFLARISINDYSKPYIDQIIQTAIYFFQVMPLQGSQLLQTLAKIHTKEMLKFYEKLFNYFSQNIQELDLNIQKKLINMFLYLTSENKNYSFIQYLQNVVYNDCTSSIQSMNENIIVKLIDFLKDLFSNESGLGVEIENIFYKETINNAINILSQIMATDSENILEHLCDLFISLANKNRLTNITNILSWVELILPYLQLPSFFKLLECLDSPLTPTIAKIILELTPSHGNDLITSMFGYLKKIFPKTQEFWSIFSIDFILSFFNSLQFPIIDALLSFLSVSFYSPETSGYIPYVVKFILLNFLSSDLFNKSNQRTAIQLFKNMKKEKQNPECIINLLTEIYPIKTEPGNNFIDLFTRRDNPSDFKLIDSLCRHIQININSQNN